MKLIVHVGIHKTASTLLQTAMAQNMHWLEAKGVFYVNEHAPYIHTRHREVLRRAQNPSRKHPGPDALVKPNRRLLRMAENSGAEAIVISEENRIGVPMYRDLVFGEQNARYYPNATELLALLLRGLEDIETEFILDTRDFSSWLPSIYSEAMRSLAIALSFEEFLQRVDFETLDNLELQKRILRVRSDAKIHVLKYEAIQAGVEQFQREFVGHFVDTADGFVAHTDRVRGSLSQSQLADLIVLARKRSSSGMTKQ